MLKEIGSLISKTILGEIDRKGILTNLVIDNNTQIGTADSPSNLKLNGNVSIKVNFISPTAAPVKIYVDENSTILAISNSISSAINVYLPSSPSDGQIVIVCDFSGTAATYSITLNTTDSSLIDTSATKAISTNSGYLGVIWSKTKWITFTHSTSSGAPTTSQYLTLATDATLSAERVLTPATGLIGTDGGANSPYTLNIDNNIVATITGSTFSGPVIGSNTGGFTGSLTKLVNGTSFLVAGTNTTITSQSNGSILIASTGGGGAPTTSQYLTLATDAALSAERIFTPSTGIIGTDSGADSPYTLTIDNNKVATITGSTFSGPVIGSSTNGFTGSLTKLVDGTSFLIAGSSMAITSQSNGSIIFNYTGNGATPGGSSWQTMYDIDFTSQPTQAITASTAIIDGKTWTVTNFAQLNGTIINGTGLLISPVVASSVNTGLCINLSDLTGSLLCSGSDMRISVKMRRSGGINGANTNYSLFHLQYDGVLNFANANRTSFGHESETSALRVEYFPYGSNTQTNPQTNNNNDDLFMIKYSNITTALYSSTSSLYNFWPLSNGSVMRMRGLDAGITPIYSYSPPKTLGDIAVGFYSYSGAAPEFTETISRLTIEIG